MPSSDIPASLREFAEDEGLPDADVQMLASIQFRGEQPRTKERWRYLYTAISTSAVREDRVPRGLGRGQDNRPHSERCGLA